jgi:hypothetical protein
MCPVVLAEISHQAKIAAKIRVCGEVPSKVGDVPLGRTLIVIDAGRGKAAKNFNDRCFLLRGKESCGKYDDYQYGNPQNRITSTLARS